MGQSLKVEQLSPQIYGQKNGKRPLFGQQDPRNTKTTKN